MPYGRSGSFGPSSLYYQYAKWLNILRTSRQIYSEVAAILYAQQLCFYVIKTGIEFFTMRNSSLGAAGRSDQPTILKFRRIRIEIEDPHRDSLHHVSHLLECILIFVNRKVFRRHVHQTLTNSRLDLDVVFPSNPKLPPDSGWRYGKFVCVLKMLGTVSLRLRMHNLKIQTPVNLAADKGIEALIVDLEALAAATQDSPSFELRSGTMITIGH